MILNKFWRLGQKEIRPLIAPKWSVNQLFLGNVAYLIPAICSRMRCT